MKSNNYLILSTLLLAILALTACGTFEIGLEGKVTPLFSIESEANPPEGTPIIPMEQPTEIPVINDDTAIQEALAHSLGVSIEELEFSISENTGAFAKGGVSNGYFLAAKDGEGWVILYDGQAAPPCQPVDEYQFPFDMVPECMAAGNQVVTRQGSAEAEIKSALAARLDISVDELTIQITQYNGLHTVGNVSNGYFLAAQADGEWVIVYDGQATPPCQDIEAYQFPIDMVLECLDASDNLVVRTGDTNPTEEAYQTLACAEVSPESADYVACNIQDGLRSRNTSALIGYMADPFIIGYWQSEGVMDSPSEMIPVLHGLYNFDDPNYTPQLTFTTDREQFPAMGGMQPEAMFGSDVNIIQVIYSQGWGQDGQGGALIFITGDPEGGYTWYGMGYSADNFSH